jgi:hypothetical protein
MMTIKKDRNKLKQLIHYVAYRSADNPAALGAVKLNKVLWYSDQIAYLSTGTPITGEKYIKKQRGPVSSNLMPLVTELEQEDKLAVRNLDNQGTQFLALTTPDVSMFKSEEIRIIEDAIQIVCHQHTARSISEQSHDIVWKLAELDEEIPYHAILAGRLHEIESDDVEWAREQLKA